MGNSKSNQRSTVEDSSGIVKWAFGPAFLECGDARLFPWKPSFLVYLNESEAVSKGKSGHVYIFDGLGLSHNTGEISGCTGTNTVRVKKNKRLAGWRLRRVAPERGSVSRSKPWNCSSDRSEFQAALARFDLLRLTEPRSGLASDGGSVDMHTPDLRVD